MDNEQFVRRDLSDAHVGAAFPVTDGCVVAPLFSCAIGAEHDESAWPAVGAGQDVVGHEAQVRVDAVSMEQFDGRPCFAIVY